ncbi:hypothetical protein M231_06447 [Tremella mesenterica]|uniref:HECT-type E3 ubiquitin transferase n=1 Tax=Tremella mesenterica TaxID=5217 RepID=A0A4Q1BG94_TREME|nr:uncharacterized protein TREMEDRAFT_37646 [Tremella mesenterica DSM 1558]EIW71232.1 hypothetical protein TREMEDRAFT_37646 [Tremella mesenterica DSM 1558]RXK36311.1 hypothetical protein M231_06447 [Tremella mesenterica]
MSKRQISDIFDAPYNRVNLSTSTATSSSTLLSNVRAERAAREHRRREADAALKIQKLWRGGVFRKQLQEQLLDDYEAGRLGPMGGRMQTRAVWFLLRTKVYDEERVARFVGSWLAEGIKPDEKGLPLILQPLRNGLEYLFIIGAISSGVVRLCFGTPTKAWVGVLLTNLESLISPIAYAPLQFPVQTKKVLVCVLALTKYIEWLVRLMEKLIDVTLPKKKHPFLLPVVRLITVPFTLNLFFEDFPLCQPVLAWLLTIPALPAALPLSALTYLSQKLPLFQAIIPTTVTRQSWLSSGRLATEIGKTHFLANLALFGISGTLLNRLGPRQFMAWMIISGEVLGSLGEGWGPWVEGQVEDKIIKTYRPIVSVDSDDEDESADIKTAARTFKAPIPVRRRRPNRSPLPASISTRLALLASPQHLSLVFDKAIAVNMTTPPGLMAKISPFFLGLLHAFRGTAKWELILDTFLAGNRGRVIVKRLWFEAVQGRWSDSADYKCWDKFAENRDRNPLILLTQLYSRYLVLTPDDEFFSTANLLSIPEVMELSAVWRNLAYWGYMSGVAYPSNPSSIGRGTEHHRSLFTKIVTQLAERNARRKFTADNFWDMPGARDLPAFVVAAVIEDSQLAEFDPANQEPQGRPVPDVRHHFSRRQMAWVSPRLGLLNNLPMAVPFIIRLQVFREFIITDAHEFGHDRYSRRSGKATIRRDHLAQDGFDQLNELGSALKGTIVIKFVDQFGQREAGVDGGGLFKEFLTNLSKEVFDTERGLWLATDQNALYPNPHSYAVEPHQLQWYGFIGRMLGKAIYEGILVDVSFAPFFLAKWLGKQSYLDDLSSLDPELYKGLIILKNYPKPEDLALNFTVTQQEFGTTQTVDLVPGGSEIPVTAENRHEYIQLVCKYKLDQQISAQSKAFFNGLAEVIDQKWLRMFDQHELQQLIGGEETPIDIDDLRENSNITGFIHNETVPLFWKVVRQFNEEERRALLKFVTSCERPPLLGFANLNPKFGIHSSGTNTDRLPSASSCFNLLKLPEYTDERVLRQKLLQAITSGAGFDLS